MPEWLSQFDAQLEVQPPLTDQQLAALPRRRGVFLLAAEGDRPIVLLTGADIRARLATRLKAPTEQERKKTPDLGLIARKILWKLSTSHFETDLHFLDLARAIWPEDFAELPAWRPAWFVHVDAQDPYPHFRRTREVLAGAGLYLGPFGDGRSAERFIQAVQDAFSLCRHYQCLRRSPRAQPCAYLQMGLCLGPCDGTMSMDKYRRAVALAAEFARGNRQPFAQELQRRMKQAAGQLQFERAAWLKARLERLKEFDSPAFAHVAPAEQFQFVAVQSATSRQAKVFLVDRGDVAAGSPLDYPLVPGQLSRALEEMRAFAGAPRTVGPVQRWRMGLVAHFLFSAEPRRGVILRWSPELTPERLGEAVESAAGALRLRAPKPRKKKAGPGPTDQAGPEDRAQP